MAGVWVKSVDVECPNCDADGKTTKLVVVREPDISLEDPDTTPWVRYSLKFRCPGCMHTFDWEGSEDINLKALNTREYDPKGARVKW